MNINISQKHVCVIIDRCQPAPLNVDGRHENSPKVKPKHRGHSLVADCTIAHKAFLHVSRWELGQTWKLHHKKLFSQCWNAQILESVAQLPNCTNPNDITARWQHWYPGYFSSMFVQLEEVCLHFCQWQGQAQKGLQPSDEGHFHFMQVN